MRSSVWETGSGTHNLWVPLPIRIGRGLQQKNTEKRRPRCSYFTFPPLKTTATAARPFPYTVDAPIWQTASGG